MAEISWLNAIDGNFDTAADWSTGTVPGVGDDAILGADGGSPYTVTASASETVNSLNIASGDILSITGGKFEIRHRDTLGVNSAITVSGGATLVLKGETFGQDDQSSVTVGDGSKAIIAGGSIVACVLKSTGSGKFIVKGQSELAYFTAATIDITHGASVFGDWGFEAGGVVNLAKTGGAELIVAPAASNAGLINLHTGDSIVASGGVPIASGRADTLVNESGGTISGAGQIGMGATPSGKIVVLNKSGALIDAHGPGVLTIDTGHLFVLNSGTIEATDRGRCEIMSPVNQFDVAGILMAAGGTLEVKKAVSGNESGVIDGGTLSFGSIFTGNVAFTGASGVLRLAQSQGYTGGVTGFSLTGGTSFDLRDIGFVGAGEASFSGTAHSGVLTVTDGTHTAHITLIGDYTGSTFVASDDGHGGVSIVDPTKTDAMAAPAHRFIAAMAGLAGSAGGAVHAAHAGPVHEPMLFKPRAMIA